MKKAVLILLFFIAMVGNAICDDFFNPAAYKNSIVKLQNGIVEKMLDMAKAFEAMDSLKMISAYEKLTTQIDYSIDSLINIEENANDSGYYRSIKELFNNFRSVALNDYPIMISILGKGGANINRSEAHIIDSIQAGIIEREEVLLEKLKIAETKFAEGYELKSVENPLQKEVDSLNTQKNIRNEAIEYNNHIIAEQDKLVKQLVELTNSFERRDKKEMKEKLADFRTQARLAIKRMKRMDAMIDDPGMKETAMKLFRFYSNSSKEELRDIVSLLSKSKIVKDDIDKVNELNARIIKKEKSLNSELSDAQRKFAEAFNLPLADTAGQSENNKDAEKERSAANYYDKILEQQNIAFSKFNEFKEAMSSQDLEKLDSIYFIMKTQFNKSTGLIEKMDAFNGSSDFKEAALALMEGYSGFIAKEITEMISIYKQCKFYPDEPQADRLQQIANIIKRRGSELSDNFAKAQKTFLEQNNIILLEE